MLVLEGSVTLTILSVITGAHLHVFNVLGLDLHARSSPDARLTYLRNSSVDLSTPALPDDRKYF